jgi:hypothetical protein
MGVGVVLPGKHNRERKSARIIFQRTARNSWRCIFGGRGSMRPGETGRGSDLNVHGSARRACNTVLLLGCCSMRSAVALLVSLSGAHGAAVVLGLLCNGPVGRNSLTALVSVSTLNECKVGVSAVELLEVTPVLLRGYFWVCNKGDMRIALVSERSSVVLVTGLLGKVFK